MGGRPPRWGPPPPVRHQGSQRPARAWRDAARNGGKRHPDDSSQRSRIWPCTLAPTPSIRHHRSTDRTDETPKTGSTNESDFSALKGPLKTAIRCGPVPSLRSPTKKRPGSAGRDAGLPRPRGGGPGRGRRAHDADGSDLLLGRPRARLWLHGRGRHIPDARKLHEQVKQNAPADWKDGVGS